jgi:adenylate cyclase
MAETEATFGFVDLAGFTALTEAHGDSEAVALLERFATIARESLGPSDRLVKTIGDAAMIAFADPSAAIDATARLFDTLVAEDRLPVARAGLHHGTAIEQDGDFFGNTVNIAARVAGQAQGGQVLATQAVADVARSRGVPVVDLGNYVLRNLVAPLELFELGLSEASAGKAIDPVCRMQIPRTSAAGRLRHGESDFWFCSLDCAGNFAADPDRYLSHLER